MKTPMTFTLLCILLASLAPRAEASYVLFGFDFGNVIEQYIFCDLLPSTFGFWQFGCTRIHDAPVAGMTIVESSRSFDQTYDELINMLNGIAPISIIAEVDHQANAESAGLSLDPTRVVLFGNPALGTPIMQENLMAGLDLPQKMLVWMEGPDGTVFVGYNEPSYHVARYGENLEQLEQLTTISGALRNIAAAAAGVEADSIVPTAPLSPFSDDGVFVTESDNDFQTTWDNLLATIEASPAGIAATLDHAANAETVGLDLSGAQSRLVVFGNPNVGTPFMQSEQTAGIDLPLKILVTEDPSSGDVSVTTNQLEFLQDRHGFSEVDVTMARTAVMNFVTSATTAN